MSYYTVIIESESGHKHGTATSYTANKLNDTTLSQFTSADVGKIVWNIMDNSYATITTYNSTSQVTLDYDIFIRGYEPYRMYEKTDYQVKPSSGEYELEISASNVARVELDASQEDYTYVNVGFGIKIYRDGTLEYKGEVKNRYMKGHNVIIECVDISERLKRRLLHNIGARIMLSMAIWREQSVSVIPRCHCTRPVPYQWAHLHRILLRPW